MLLRSIVDIGLVLLLVYMALAAIRERRTRWIVRGLVGLVLLLAVSHYFGLHYLNTVLNYLVLVSAVATAMVLQSELRWFLEQLGRGEVLRLLLPPSESTTGVDGVIDEIVDAVKELSQSRTGALLLLETGRPIDERDFSVPGVRLNAEMSKELIQTIFQTSTLLHDGAVLIRATRIMAAGVILPLSEQATSRRLGTRHRAAMGITERVPHCVCVVVSEETGSISLAHKGTLNRPLTSSKLKELLEERFSHTVEREVATPDFRGLGRRLGLRWLRIKGSSVLGRIFRFSLMASREQK